MVKHPVTHTKTPLSRVTPFRRNHGNISRKSRMMRIPDIDTFSFYLHGFQSFAHVARKESRQLCHWLFWVFVRKGKLPLPLQMTTAERWRRNKVVVESCIHHITHRHVKSWVEDVAACHFRLAFLFWPIYVYVYTRSEARMFMTP